MFWLFLMWLNPDESSRIPLTWYIVVLRTSHLWLSFLFAVLGKHASHCARHITSVGGLYPPIPGIIHAVICSCGFCACPFESSNLAWETRGPFWLQRLSCRLRSVKMEQRKLNDQANTLVDLAKVIPRGSAHGCNHGNQPLYSNEQYKFHKQDYQTTPKWWSNLEAFFSKTHIEFICSFPIYPTSMLKVSLGECTRSTIRHLRGIWNDISSMQGQNYILNVTMRLGDK